MAVDQLAGLLAEESRARAFAAVALGADTAAVVIDRTGLTPKQVLTALRRLQNQGIVVSDSQGLRVGYENLRELARAESSRPEAEEAVSSDQQTASVVRTFVQEGRLVRLPAQWERKKLVLSFIAERTFQAGVEYQEREVNDKLRAWCEGGQLDHVTLRRYLVDLHHLHRRNGVYWASAV